MTIMKVILASILMDNRDEINFAAYRPVICRNQNS
jgi:hypothetical protein